MEVIEEEVVDANSTTNQTQSEKDADLEIDKNDPIFDRKPDTNPHIFNDGMTEESSF